MKNKKTIIISILILIILLLVVFKPQNIILRNIYTKDYSDYVYKYAQENNIDPLLIFSIIKVESKFNYHAESSSQAIGLMQLMEPTAIEIANKMNLQITKKDLYNPQINIQIGIKYFSYLLNYYNQNQYLAIAAYNAGVGNVDKWINDGIINEDGSNIENIPYKETNNYVRKVIRDYNIYKELYNN